MLGVKGERLVGENRKAIQTTLLQPRHLLDPTCLTRWPSEHRRLERAAVTTSPAVF